MNSQDIEELRNEIDKIDDKLVELLVKRFELTNQITEVKKANSLDMEDASREEIIKARYVHVALPEGYADKFFNNLFDEVKKLAKK